MNHRWSQVQKVTFIWYTHMIHLCDTHIWYSSIVTVRITSYIWYTYDGLIYNAHIWYSYMRLYNDILSTKPFSGIWFPYICHTYVFHAYELICKHAQSRFLSDFHYTHVCHIYDPYIQACWYMIIYVTHIWDRTCMSHIWIRVAI